MMPPLIPNTQALNLNETIKTPVSPTSTTQQQTESTRNIAKASPNQLVNNTQNLATNTTQVIQLPMATRQALNQITQSLTTQQPLASLLSQAKPSDQIAEETNEDSPPEEKLLSLLFRHAVALTGDKTQLANAWQTAIKGYNTSLEDANKQQENWQEQLEEMLDSLEGDSQETLEDHELIGLAQKWLTRSQHNAFMQQLQLNAGNAILLQDIPFRINEQWHGAHVEIERSPQGEEYEWKLLVQFSLDENTQITSKLVLNAQQEIQVYLWTNQQETTQALQENIQSLTKSLYDIGLLPQTIMLATGKAPQGKDTQKPSSLVGSVNVTT
jgi:hypothetical protein